MVAPEKMETLQSVETENKFRETILMALLDKMGLSPVHTHSSGERGKDIVCKEENSFDILEWIAIVAKIGKVTGSTSGPASFQTVLNQVHEAFSYAYKDPVSKRDVSINKVLVVTNDEILSTAKQKIVDKLGMPSAKHANVHFIDGEQLAKLIDEHWRDFWRLSAELLSDEDWMTEEAGLVLYVLARAHSQAQAGKRKRAESEVPRDKIQRQTGLPRASVDAALKYLLRWKYVEEKKKNTFRLHHKDTVGSLLVDPNEIRLLFAIKSIASEDFRFTRERVLEEAKKDVLSFAPAFVKQTLAELVTGEYIRKDESRGAGHFMLEVHNLDEERPYLEAQLKYLGRIPSRAE